MRAKSILILLGIAIGVLFVCNLVLGSVNIPLGQAFKVLTGGDADKATWNFIILQSRLPRPSRPPSAVPRWLFAA